MSYPSDSVYAPYPAGDTGQGTPTAFHDQVYSLPPSGGAGGESYLYGNTSFAPTTATPESLPPITVGPEAAPFTDSAAGTEGVPGVPADQQNALPGDLSGAQTGANPWDTYVMDPVAESKDGTGAPTDGTVAPTDAAAQPQAVAQLEQQLQTSFDEVVRLGTASDLSQPENQQNFQAALTRLVQTAETLGQIDSMQAGRDTTQPASMPAGAMPVQPEAIPAEAGGMPQPEAVPADAVGPQPEAVAPQPEAVAPQPEAVAPQPEAVAPQPEAVAPQSEAVAPQPEAVDPQPGAEGVQPGAPLEVNPYEPQVSPYGPQGFTNDQQAVPNASQELTPEIVALQNDLRSKLMTLMSIAKDAQPTAGAPAAPTNSGTVDNFKTALLNIVRTAREMGAKEQAGQDGQPAPIAQPTAG